MEPASWVQIPAEAAGVDFAHMLWEMHKSINLSFLLSGVD